MAFSIKTLDIFCQIVDPSHTHVCSIIRMSDGYRLDNDGNTFKDPAEIVNDEFALDIYSLLSDRYYFAYRQILIEDTTIQDGYYYACVVDTDTGQQFGGDEVLFINNMVPHNGYIYNNINTAVAVASGISNKIKGTYVACTSTSDNVDTGILNPMAINITSIVNKLPSGYIMGSENQSNYSDDISSMASGITTIINKLPLHFIMGSEDQNSYSGTISSIYSLVSYASGIQIQTLLASNNAHFDAHDSLAWLDLWDHYNVPGITVVRKDISSVSGIISNVHGDLNTVNSNTSGIQNTADEILENSATLLINLAEHEAAQAAHRSAFIGMGSGINAVSITLKENDTDGDPIYGARVKVTNNSGATILSDGNTNANGLVVFALDNSPSGSPYKVIISSYTHHYFSGMPLQLIVSGTTPVEYYGLPFSPINIGNSQTCVVYDWLIGIDGAASSGIEIIARLASPDTVYASGGMIVPTEQSVSTNSSGYFEIELVRGVSMDTSTPYNIYIDGASYAKKITVPDLPSVRLYDII